MDTCQERLSESFHTRHDPQGPRSILRSPSAGFPRPVPPPRAPAGGCGDRKASCPAGEVRGETRKSPHKGGGQGKPGPAPCAAARDRSRGGTPPASPRGQGEKPQASETGTGLGSQKVLELLHIVAKHNREILRLEPCGPGYKCKCGHVLTK